MTKKDYLDKLPEVTIDLGKVQKIQERYGTTLPELIQRMISCCSKAIFFEDGSRMLSYEEIMDAEHDLHVAFRSMKILPLADCGENNFIVYHYEDDIWSKFNIVDETVFKKKNTIFEVLR